MNRDSCVNELIFKSMAISIAYFLFFLFFGSETTMLILTSVLSSFTSYFDFIAHCLIISNTIVSLIFRGISNAENINILFYFISPLYSIYYNLSILFIITSEPLYNFLTIVEQLFFSLFNSFSII